MATAIPEFCEFLLLSLCWGRLFLMFQEWIWFVNKYCSTRVALKIALYFCVVLFFRGRGKGGREFGGVWYSFVLRTPVPLTECFMLPSKCSLCPAVVHTILSVCQSVSIDEHGFHPAHDRLSYRVWIDTYVYHV